MVLAPLTVASSAGAPEARAAGLATHGGTEALLDHVMAQAALASAAARLPWLLDAPAEPPATRAALAARAHQMGAAGLVISSESEARGATSLFQRNVPPPR